jgi:hypothetical protein
MYFFVRNHFGVVAAAIQGNVDCEDYISHVHLGLSGMVFEQKTNRFEPPVIANLVFIVIALCRFTARTAIHMLSRLSNELLLLLKSSLRFWRLRSKLRRRRQLR